MRLLLALAACLLLSACGSSSSSPSPSPPIPPSESQPLGPSRKEFFYFTAKVGDLEETRDHITMVWAFCWGGTSQADSGVPLIGEFAQCVFIDNRYRGDVDAEGLLREMFNRWKRADALPRIAKLYIDEPTQSAEVLGQGVAAVRKVMAEYPELANTRMMICIGDEGAGKENYVGMTYFDDCDVDAYGERARIIEPNGRIDRLRTQLKPNQRYYITLGLNTGVATLNADEIKRIADYALADPWCGGIDGFTWFDRKEPYEDGSLGARSQPELRAACVDAGKRFLEYNKAIAGETA